MIEWATESGRLHGLPQWLARVVGTACLTGVASALAALPATATSAQETRLPDTVTISGKVLDEVTGDPISGVVVRLTAPGLTLVSDEEGGFAIERIVRGSYQVHLIHPDYLRLDGDLEVERSGELALRMTPIAAPGSDMITGVVGIVTDRASGRPVPEVVARLPGVGRTARTDDEGRFILAELPPGRHEVAFSHLGYQPRSVSVEVQAGHATRLQVTLAVDAIALDPIEVEVERRQANLDRVGFYQRREDGWGHFVEHDELEYAARVTDALTRFPGVTTVPDPRMPSRQFLALRRMGAPCFPAVYLDGVPIGDARSVAGINDIVSPLAVAGIEIYRGTAGTPPQYWGTSSSCGAVLIWLRRGG